MLILSILLIVALVYAVYLYSRIKIDVEKKETVSGGAGPDLVPGVPVGPPALEPTEKTIEKEPKVQSQKALEDPVIVPEKPKLKTPGKPKLTIVK